jgi:hypothetical protein
MDRENAAFETALASAEARATFEACFAKSKV